VSRRWETRRSSSFAITASSSSEYCKDGAQFIFGRILERGLQFQLLGAESGDCLDVRLGLVLAALFDRFLAVLVEIICQRVQEMRSETASCSDWAAARVARLAGLERDEICFGIAHALFLRD